MYENIENYINKSRDERRAHLNLIEDCLEIGGSGSSEYKALLAYHLKTTIPTKVRKIYLCHACNNPICCNPKHLYWGTPKDNHIDQVENGTYVPIYERLVNKYGVDGAREKLSNQNHSGRKTTLKEYSDEEVQRFLSIIQNSGFPTRGWLSKASAELGFSHTHVKRLLDKFGIKPNT